VERRGIGPVASRIPRMNVRDWFVGRVAVVDLHKEVTSMTRQTSTLLAFGALVLGIALTSAVEGSGTALNTQHFTFSRAVALPGTELVAGTYVFERLSVAEPNVVVVRSQDRAKVYFTGLTELVNRPANMKHDAPALLLGEVRRGQAIPITTWYPVGARQGHRFIYPQ
jgi:hypothetical protein